MRGHTVSKLLIHTVNTYYSIHNTHTNTFILLQYLQIKIPLYILVFKQNKY